MSESKDIIERFGAPVYYEDTFHELDRSKLPEEFRDFNAKRKDPDAYEVARQRFLKLLGQRKLIWQPTNEECDLDVEISRIYCYNRQEYLAFMKIEPRGFRGERVVPAGIEIVFHVLFGTVIFTNRKITRRMDRGKFSTVKPKAKYSIRCPNEENPGVLIFRVTNNNKKTKKH